MGTLEDFIRENKDMFMTSEPSDGHFDRFEMKIRKMNQQRKLLVIMRVATAAAACLMLAASTVFLYDRFFSRQPVMNLGDVSPQMQKVEFFYTSQIDGLAGGIDTLSASADEGTRKMMNAELAEMDSVHRNLQLQLGSHPDDERVINAMILYYQTKLQVMTSFLNTLHQIKQNNNPKKSEHESTLL